MAPGYPLLTPPPLWCAAALGGLSYVTILGADPTLLPAPLASLGLAVVSSATARSISVVAWAVHTLEGAVAAASILKGGGDGRAAAWWGAMAFLFGFPALLQARAAVAKDD
jgi:hypothetical protein